MTITDRSRGRGVLALLMACSVACLLALLAPALAGAEVRSYVGQTTGLDRPEGLTIDGNDGVWVSDLKNGLISQYAPWPSQQKLSTQNGGGIWGGALQVRSLAVSAANEFLYTFVDNDAGANCGNTPQAIFDDKGALYRLTTPGTCQIWLAVDNYPQSDSYGRYYAWSEGRVQLYDGYSNPVDFTGQASYIDGNAITGTPKGPFGEGAAGFFTPEISGITVNPSNGHIWVIDAGSYYRPSALFEYNTEGIFLQEITAKSADIPPRETPSGPRTFGFGPGLAAIAVDPTNGNVLVSDRAGLVIDEFSPEGKLLGVIDGSGTPNGHLGYTCNKSNENLFCYTNVTGLGVDSRGYVYVADGDNHAMQVYAPRPAQPKISVKPRTNPTTSSETVNALVDPNGAGPIVSCRVEYGTAVEFLTHEYKLGPVPCTPGTPFADPTEVHAEISGLTPETTYHYRFAVGYGGDTRYGEDQTITTHRVLGLRADPASAVSTDSATLNGSFVGNGAATNYWFEYGTTPSYGSKLPLPAPPGASAGSPAGPARSAVEVAIGGLEPVTRYHYRIVAENGSTSASEDQSFRTDPLLPAVKESVTNLHSDEALFNTQINPGGADTVFTFEYGTEDCSLEPDPCAIAFEGTHVGSNLSFSPGQKRLTGLTPGTIYYYRAIATNSAGTSYGPVRRFSTFPFTAELKDACGNALSRQQTGAALLLDCRSYELVSSAHAGGYDVESTLVPSQVPFEGYPRAGADGTSRALYGIHNGAIPGVPGNPTNRGVDPYIATRGGGGWTTSYVGIPANNPNAGKPFSSTLGEADPRLGTFAFAGPGICSPCFGDGSTGVPVHLPDGSLVQGMKGSIPQPGATEDGLVRKRLSADGGHLVFSSTSQFEPAGNSAGDVSIYVRDLPNGPTRVVSTDPAGNPLACLQGAGSCHGPGNAAGISELDISADGSRVVVGQLVSTDPAGNAYYHLYMHVAGSQGSIDLTPGTTAGALYDGMTADGSRVFLTSADHLAAGDTDTSADVFEATVSGAAASLRLLSTAGGAPRNDDSCTPVGSPNSWNSAAGNGHCSALAFAGGAGVASDSGSFYFLSPELLDGGLGSAGQPNLYAVSPGGAPDFVATVDSANGGGSIDDPAVVHAVQQSEIHSYGDFQVTPSGQYAAFVTREPLDANFLNEEYAEIYRYAPASQELLCVSCAPTSVPATGDASLASRGLSLVDDGRVFFDTDEPLVLRDGDNAKDVYEWERSGQGNCDGANPNLFATGVCVALISSGTSQFDSGLLSAGADATDVFFFTHDSLAPEDENGPLTKLYDARSGGGFFAVPPPAGCVASDECHGPGTVEAGPPAVGTVAGKPAPASGGKAKCKKGKVSKHGKCVKKKKKKRKHAGRHRGGRR